jgi:hypothetical protein
MFARSAAPDTLQGRAIQAVNEKWGDIDFKQRAGRESIGFPVCKKKYAPFAFPLVVNVEGEADVRVERMYGCRIHHDLRKTVIETHGERDGWEPFGQWSLQKAKEMARQETCRIRRRADGENSAPSITETDDEDTSSTSDGSSLCLASRLKRRALMCQNGTCAWKVKTAYDDIYYEINGRTESEAEDNVNG